MELKRYNEKIRNQLLGCIRGQAHRDHNIYNGGSFEDHGKRLDEAYHAMMTKFQQHKGPMHMLRLGETDHDCNPPGSVNVVAHDYGGTISRKKYARKQQKPCLISDSESDSDDDGMKGGRFNFVKAISHVGKEVAHGVKAVGSDAFNDVKKAATVVAKSELDKQAAKAINYIGKSAMSTASVLPEVAEEAAPLAMAAAGMKRTRKVSAKEANRHALIRKLMSKHKCTLAEASKHIKQKNLQY